MPRRVEPLDDKKIESRIFLLRGQKVILDADLATLYGVTTKRLNEQVKRNKERFPEDFTFQLTPAEKDHLKAMNRQLYSLKFSKTNPYAFTEHGAIMAASVLDSPHAIHVSLLVIRIFVKMRQMVSIHKEFRNKLIELEQRVDDHDGLIRDLIKTLNQLMEPPIPAKKRSIGFTPWTAEEKT